MRDSDKVLYGDVFDKYTQKCILMIVCFESYDNDHTRY